MNRLSPTKTNNTTVQPVTQTQSDSPSSTNTQEYFIGEDVTFSSNMANDTTPNNSSTSMTQNDAVLHGLEQQLQQEESGDESDDLELTDAYLAQHGGIKTEEKPPAKMEGKPSMGGDDDDDGDDGSSSGDDDSTSSDEEDKDNKDMDGEDSTNDNSYQDEYEEEKTNVKTRNNKKKKKKPPKRNAKADTNDDTKDLVAAATRKSKRSKKGSEPQRFRDSDYVNGSIKAAPVSSSKRAAIPNSAKGSKGVLCSDLANGNMSGDIIMEPGNAILPMTQLQSSYSMLAIHNLMSVVTNPEHLAPHSLWSIPSDAPPSDCCIMKPSKPSVHIKKKKSSKQSKKVNHGPKTLLTILYTNLLKMYEHDRKRYLACRYEVNRHACTFIHENMQVIEDEAFHSSFIFLYSFLVSEACFNNVGIDQISDHMYRYINSNSSEDICSRVRTIESELEAIKNMRR